jgi:hypothetical protein
VVVAREYSSGDRRLIAYIVPRHGTVSPARVREFAAERLPSYMQFLPRN